MAIGGNGGRATDDDVCVCVCKRERDNVKENKKKERDNCLWANVGKSKIILR